LGYRDTAFRRGRTNCGLFSAADSPAPTQGRCAIFIFRRNRLRYYRVCRISHVAGRSCFRSSAGTLPFATAVIAWLWFGQKPLPAYRAALVAVFAGILLTAADSFSRGSLTRMQITGDLLFLCGSSSWAVFTLLLGHYSVRPLAATVTTTLGSALVYLPVWWLFLPSRLTQAPLSEIAAQALYQGVLVVFISMLLYSFAISRLGPHTVALQMAFVPGISAVAAVLLLDEPMSLLTLAGLIAVTIGAVLGAHTANEAGAEGKCANIIYKA
jgi:drug/metabolite transporter (DMT)-like permease